MTAHHGTVTGARRHRHRLIAAFGLMLSFALPMAAQEPGTPAVTMRVLDVQLHDALRPADAPAGQDLLAAAEPGRQLLVVTVASSRANRQVRFRWPRQSIDAALTLPDGTRVPVVGMLATDQTLAALGFDGQSGGMGGRDIRALVFVVPMGVRGEATLDVGGMQTTCTIAAGQPPLPVRMNVRCTIAAPERLDAMQLQSHGDDSRPAEWMRVQGAVFLRLPVTVSLQAGNVPSLHEPAFALRARDFAIVDDAGGVYPVRTITDTLPTNRQYRPYDRQVSWSDETLPSQRQVWLVAVVRDDATGLELVYHDAPMGMIPEPLADDTDQPAE